MRLRNFLFALLVYSSFSFATEEDIPYAGVWNGYIGDHQVQVCFSLDGSSYYYLRHLRGIPLLKVDDTTQFSDWRESKSILESTKVTGKWKITRIADDLLEGYWSDPADTTRLKITLKKAPDITPSETGEYGSCGATFFKPILDDAPKNKNLKAYKLPSSYAGASKFNAYVGTWLKEQAVEDYDCHLNSGKKREIELAPEVLTDKVLVVRETLFDVYCGGNHNVSGNSYYIFDPQTGNKINTWVWIKGGESSVNKAAYNSPAMQLRALIEKMNPATKNLSVNNV